MKKYIILSDIHSNWEALNQLEETVKEFKENESQVIFAGDYIDGNFQKAGYGLKVLDYIMDLVQKKKAIALLGNHDNFWLQTSQHNEFSYEDWLDNGGDNTIATNLGIHDYDFHKVYHILNNEPFLKYTNFLAQLPRKFMTDTILITHAGINWDYEIAHQHPDDLLWIRESYIRAEKFVNLNRLDRLIVDNFKRVIVTGHTPTQYIEKESNHNIIKYTFPCFRYFIDGGSGKDPNGQLNVLVLDESGKELNQYVLK